MPSDDPTEEKSASSEDDDEYELDRLAGAVEHDRILRRLRGTETPEDRVAWERIEVERRAVADAQARFESNRRRITLLFWLGGVAILILLLLMRLLLAGW